jgi:hypothetical protein
MIRSRQTIKAGKRGTMKFIRKFGSDLVNVRYYYDLKKKKKITTVELLIWEKEWIPKKFNPKKPVKLRIDWGEKELAKKVKENGGKWNKELKVWIIPFGKVKEMKLQSRIVGF